VLDIDHKAECPFVTGVWPVLLSDLSDDLCCAGCGGRKLVVGEHYTTIPVTGDDGHTDEALGEVVCLGCGAERLMLA